MPEPDTDIEGDVSGLGLGERLRSARKARALSLEQVAESLHLDESVVLALEDERFETFGAPVFVRGHLKAYARLVGLPIDSVLEAYRKADPSDAAVSPLITREASFRPVAVNPVMWGFWGMVALIGVALAAYVLQDDGASPVPVIRPTADPVRAEVQTGSSDLDGEAPAQEIAAFVTPEEIPGVEEPDAARDAAPAPEPGTDLAPRPEMVRLTLHFRQESWVEISDANRRLLFGLQHEGRRRELMAEPPIQLLLGNAGGVDLTVDDQPYAVPLAGVTGKVARFEIASAEVE